METSLRGSIVRVIPPPGRDKPDFLTRERTIVEIMKYLSEVGGYTISYVSKPRGKPGWGVLSNNSADIIGNEYSYVPSREPQVHFLRPFLYSDRSRIAVVDIGRGVDFWELDFKPLVVQFTWETWVVFLATAVVLIALWRWMESLEISGGRRTSKFSFFHTNPPANAPERILYVLLFNLLLIMSLLYTSDESANSVFQIWKPPFYNAPTLAKSGYMLLMRKGSVRSKQLLAYQEITQRSNSPEAETWKRIIPDIIKPIQYAERVKIRADLESGRETTQKLAFEGKFQTKTCIYRRVPFLIEYKPGHFRQYPRPLFVGIAIRNEERFRSEMYKIYNHAASFGMILAFQRRRVQIWDQKNRFRMYLYRQQCKVMRRNALGSRQVTLRRIGPLFKAWGLVLVGIFGVWCGEVAVSVCRKRPTGTRATHPR